MSNNSTKNALTVVEENDEVIVKKLKENGASTSAIIRQLGKNWKMQNGEADRSRIVKALKNGGVTTKNGDEIRYQHVRNVLITPIKKG